MFEDGFEDLTELPLIDTTLDDLICADSLAVSDEDITKIKIPKRGRGFVFYPSHLKTYALLKNIDPVLATLFFEDLSCYGVTGQHITRNSIVRGIMENIAPVLDRQYAKYLEYCARDRHNLKYYNNPTERYNGSFERLINNALKGIEI